jgi:hypothetical protein
VRRGNCVRHDVQAAKKPPPPALHPPQRSPTPEDQRMQTPSPVPTGPPAQRHRRSHPSKPGVGVVDAWTSPAPPHGLCQMTNEALTTQLIYPVAFVVFHRSLVTHPVGEQSWGTVSAEQAISSHHLSLFFRDRSLQRLTQHRNISRSIYSVYRDMR